jgi:hypothetical protein
MQWTDYQWYSQSDTDYTIRLQETLADSHEYLWLVYSPKGVTLQGAHVTRDGAKKAAEIHFDLSSNLF